MDGRGDEPLRCRLCGEVIGVYEPMIVVSEGVPTRTSRVAAGDEDPGEECFHSDCFADPAT